MICSICGKRDVRPPACCDKCGRLACSDCMERKVGFRFRGESPYGFDEQETIYRELCKVCRAEVELTT